MVVSKQEKKHIEELLKPIFGPDGKWIDKMDCWLFLEGLAPYDHGRRLADALSFWMAGHEEWPLQEIITKLDSMADNNWGSDSVSHDEATYLRAIMRSLNKFVDHDWFPSRQSMREYLNILTFPIRDLTKPRHDETGRAYVAKGIINWLYRDLKRNS